MAMSFDLRSQILTVFYHIRPYTARDFRIEMRKSLLRIRCFKVCIVSRTDDLGRVVEKSMLFLPRTLFLFELTCSARVNDFESKSKLVFSCPARMKPIFS